jgi:hypothetical protein
MIRKRLVRRPMWPDGSGYDPRLTIVVEGPDDVYRLARHLEAGQVEFARLGRAILRSMDEQHPGSVRALTTQLGPSSLLAGARGGRRRRGRQLRLELGMPAEQLHELEQVVR